MSTIDTAEHQRQVLAAILRELYPHGVAPEQYAQAFGDAERTAALFVRLVQAGVISAPSTPMPESPRATQAPHGRLSAGAVRALEELEAHPAKLKLEDLAERCGVSAGYVHALIAELRAVGYRIDTEKKLHEKKCRYRITGRPGEEEAP